MNKSNIEWTDYTWNPLTGCLHGCPYCYARLVAETPRTGHAFPNGFAPTERLERLSQPSEVKGGAAVFVGSMTDMLGKWWTSEQIQKVIDVCKENPQHTFLWLTKNPARYQDFKWPFNCCLGATVTNQEDAVERVPIMLDIANISFLSIEPILGPIDLSSIDGYGINQVIAGCQNGPHAMPAELDWFRALQEFCAQEAMHFFLKKVSKKTCMLDDKIYKSLMWELRK